MRQFSLEIIRFAWFPKKLTNGQWIWFKKYLSIGKIIYPKWDLPTQIEVQNQPFYIEIEKWPIEYKDQSK